MMLNARLGFVQGRLSPLVDGRIQAFPWDSWADEFEAASQCNISLMEWTLDQHRLYENPLMNSVGQKQIQALCHRYSLSIKSLTGDCFMQDPFWKAETKSISKLKNDFLAVVNACFHVGIKMIVVPLVDNGRLDTLDQENKLINFLISQAEFFKSRGVQIIFESDFEPKELRRFIRRLPSNTFGINYDSGNSASLGYKPNEEFEAYGERILNVHIKDRVLGGTTVPLGMGNVQFGEVFKGLVRKNYNGNFILQTARATDGTDIQTLCRYRNMTIDWMVEAGYQHLLSLP
jgi:L-ribulose-5-phosphate 3-epimerase